MVTTGMADIQPAAAGVLQQLAAARLRQGLTQKQVAERIGTTQSSIARLEAGTDAKLSTVLRYAEAVGVSLQLHDPVKRQLEVPEVAEALSGDVGLVVAAGSDGAVPHPVRWLVDHLQVDVALAASSGLSRVLPEVSSVSNLSAAVRRSVGELLAAGAGTLLVDQAELLDGLALRDVVVASDRLRVVLCVRDVAAGRAMPVVAGRTNLLVASGCVSPTRQARLAEAAAGVAGADRDVVFRQLAEAGAGATLVATSDGVQLVGQSDQGPLPRAAAPGTGEQPRAARPRALAAPSDVPQTGRRTASSAGGWDGGLRSASLAAGSAVPERFTSSTFDRLDADGVGSAAPGASLSANSTFGGSSDDTWVAADVAPAASSNSGGTSGGDMLLVTCGRVQDVPQTVAHGEMLGDATVLFEPEGAEQLQRVRRSGSLTVVRGRGRSSSETVSALRRVLPEVDLHEVSA